MNTTQHNDPATRKATQDLKAKHCEALKSEACAHGSQNAAEEVYQGAIKDWPQPQAQHSPLPWQVDIEDIYDNTGLCVAANLRQANAKLIVASVNHAGKLAEALRLALAFCENDAMNRPKINPMASISKALAAYEKGAR